MDPLVEARNSVEDLIDEIRNEPKVLKKVIELVSELRDDGVPEAMLPTLIMREIRSSRKKVRPGSKPAGKRMKAAGRTGSTNTPAWKRKEKAKREADRSKIGPRLTTDSLKTAVHEILSGSDVDTEITALLDEAGLNIAALKKMGPPKRNKITQWANRNPRLQSYAAARLSSVGGGRRGFLRNFFRKRRVEKYRAMLWRRHRTEILRECRLALDSVVVKHKDAVSSYLADIKSGLNDGSDPPKAAIVSLGNQLYKDRQKLFANDAYDKPTEWSKFEAENYAGIVIYYSAMYAVHTSLNFVEAMKAILASAYEDYIFNKHETDKTKYVY